jgi:predicted GNAT family N-acyltransferase
MRTIPQEHSASLRGGCSTTCYTSLHGLPTAGTALVAPAIEARDSARPYWRESRPRTNGQSAGSDPSYVRGLRWHLYGPLVPPETTGARLATVPSWLEALWAFRGAVLYDQGRRPQFQTADGRLADPDPLDVRAYHVLVYRDSAVVGCARLLPLAREVASLTETLLGERRFAQMLCDLGVGRAGAIEGGRWLVHSAHRCRGLGVQLVGAGGAVARQLGCQVVFAPVGTQTHQDHLLARLGWQPVPSLPPFDCAVFADTLRVMAITTQRPAPPLRRLMATMASTLGLVPAPAAWAPAEEAR